MSLQGNSIGHHAEYTGDDEKQGDHRQWSEGRQAKLVR